jgi:hypothetical protein
MTSLRQKLTFLKQRERDGGANHIHHGVQCDAVALLQLQLAQLGQDRKG